MKKIKKIKQIERETKMALKYAESIIATLREPFLVINKNLRIVSVNRSFCNTFKVTKKGTIGQLLPNLGNRQWNIPKLLHLLKKILPKKTVVENYEVEHEFKTIGRRIMNLNAIQLRITREMAAAITEEEEEEELILLAIEDITERRRIQERLIRTEKLASLGRLAAMLTHELRNSLSAVRNSIYSLKMFDLKDKRIKKSFRILDEESEKMDKIINSTLGSVLGFVGPRKSGKIKKDIGKIIKESITEVAVPEDVKINMKFGKPSMALVNEVHIIQLFSNIIKNAIESMPKGGQLTITTGKKNNYVVVSIQDTGRGIKKKDLDKMFEPFYSTKDNGTGLGLAICKHLVELHKGSIDVESGVGKGSKFIIRIPISPKFQKPHHSKIKN